MRRTRIERKKLFSFTRNNSRKSLLVQRTKGNNFTLPGLTGIILRDTATGKKITPTDYVEELKLKRMLNEQVG